MKGYIYRVLIVGSLVTLALVGPGRIETELLPVARNIKHEVIRNQGKEVCIRTTFDRVRKAEPVGLTWTAWSEKKGRSFIAPYRDGKKMAAIMALPLDPGKATYINCHIRPPRFRGEAYYVQIRIAYEVPWRPWDLVREDAPVLIPPEPGKRADCECEDCGDCLSASDEVRWKA